MALKHYSVPFVTCPKWGNEIEGIVLNRVCILGTFCPKHGQGFKLSAAHLDIQVLVEYPQERGGGGALPGIFTLELEEIREVLFPKAVHRGENGTWERKKSRTWKPLCRRTWVHFHLMKLNADWISWGIVMEMPFNHVIPYICYSQCALILCCSIWSPFQRDRAVVTLIALCTSMNGK